MNDLAELFRAKKAWFVFNRHEPEVGEYVLADTRNEAKRKAWTCMMGDAYIDIYAQRTPELDGTIITDKDLLEKGRLYFVECRTCFREVYPDENGEDSHPPLYDRFENVYCSQACLTKAEQSPTLAIGQERYPVENL